MTTTTNTNKPTANLISWKRSTENKSIVEIEVDDGTASKLLTLALKGEPPFDLFLQEIAMGAHAPAKAPIPTQETADRITQAAAAVLGTEQPALSPGGEAAVKQAVADVTGVDNLTDEERVALAAYEASQGIKPAKRTRRPKDTIPAITAPAPAEVVAPVATAPAVVTPLYDFSTKPTPPTPAATKTLHAPDDAKVREEIQFAKNMGEVVAKLGKFFADPEDALAWLLVKENRSVHKSLAAYDDTAIKARWATEAARAK